MSFIRNMHVYHIKRTAPVVKANLDQYATEFHDNGTSILALARQANYPPYLFARFMVEHLTTLKKTDISAAVINPMLYLSDPSILLQQQLEPSQQKTITNSDTTTARRLARDIHEAVTSDPLCGPRHDVARRVDCAFLAQLVATGRLAEDEAPEVAHDLAYRLAKEAYRL